MKNKIIKIIILFILLLICALYLYEKNSYKEHKVLKVIEADKFYIDINDNNIIDNNELFKLKDVEAFSPAKNYNSQKQSQRLNISLVDYLKAGYLARNWAIDNLEGKNVLVTYKSDNFYKATGYRLISFQFDSSDYAKTLLKYGFAYTFDDCKNVDYYISQNYKQAKKNIAALSGINFVLLNLKTNIVHKLNCEYFDSINSGELINNKFKKFLNCKICFGKNYSKHNEIKDFNREILKSKNKYPKSIHKTFGDVELFLINPLEYDKPDKNCKTTFCRSLIKLIDDSKHEIDIALYGINEQDDIFNALLRAKNRGVKIRSVVDYSKNSDTIYPDTKRFIREFDSKTDKSEVIMHNKFFIFDNEKVLTGSANISSSGMSYNSNNMILVNSKELASIYKQEFEQMFALNFSKRKRKINSDLIKAQNSEIKVYFSPKDDVLNSLLLPKIRDAQKEIFVSAFYLTDNNLIDELIMAKKRNVKVLILLDSVGAINFRERINRLRRENIPTIVENWGGKNHEKTILIDSKVFITGSCNFSKSGFYKNDENVLMIKNAELTSLYRDYYLYLFNSIDKKYLEEFPLAESFESKNSCFDGIDNNHDGKIDKDDQHCVK